MDRVVTMEDADQDQIYSVGAIPRRFPYVRHEGNRGRLIHSRTSDSDSSETEVQPGADFTNV